MSIESIFEVTRTGLNYERLRLDAAARNIAGANQPLSPGAAATRLQAPTSFAELSAAAALSEQPVSTRAVHDPGHPFADSEGRVHYPATDITHEMTTLLAASRGYEANVRAFNMLRGMVLRALEIGAK